jgi:hypothetical protein
LGRNVGGKALISVTRVLKALAVSILLGLSAFATAKLDILGLESASDRLADQVYQRIGAADYGPGRKGQREVSVVYLDESSVENLKGFGWTRFPPTFEQQSTMLDDVLNAGGAPPAAVFLDYVYMGQGGPADGFDGFLQTIAGATRASAWSGKPGCTADPLIKVACIVQAGGVPVIVARPSPADLELFTDVQRALDRVAVLAPALVAEDAYPMLTAYDFTPPKAARLGVHGFDVSPAMALYAAYCVRRADGCGLAQFRDLRARARAALAGARTASPALEKVFDAPLDVVWGSRPDPAYLSMTEAVSGEAPHCRRAATGWRERLVDQLVGIRGPGQGARQECPYTLSLGYDRMVSGAGLESKDLERLLAGKLVMLGGHFRASSDWVDSPVHGQVPGVQFHAMALDNLIETGAEYRRNASSMFDSDFLESLLISALAFCGVLAVMARNTLLDEAIASGMEPRLRSTVYGPLYILLFGASLGIVALATFAGVAYAHRSPINWIGIAGVTLGFLFYATRQTLPADICGSLEKVPIVRRGLAYGRLCFSSMRFEEDRIRPPRRRPSSSPPASPPPEPVQDASHAQA